MAKSINQVVLMGNLTRDPELRTTSGGQSVCAFSLALNRSWTGSNGQQQESVDFVDIVAWGKLGELVNQYMSKGRRCLITGRLSSSSWEAQDGSKRSKLEVTATDVTFLDGGSGSSDQGGSQPSQSSSAAPAKPKKNDDVVVEDVDEQKPVDLSDIPF
ncbi:TPA: single-stranded DNA-binding protein [Candidatus Saccharibacteria bacterium]|nr:single-stranded DNA-binding protein [Candidatus Saccharibacteria bacterium]HIO87736.1 single-stranded DNA-binding protein [Candidatus Saccharibacteria bacterium]